ncbi:MAG: methyltransferase domain-containing protein [Acidobacteriota bacterium]|nr:methyltransferase domain-containing protein [Acidobacteriota bacterium]
MSSTSSSPDYGIDAPYVIRNLLLAGGAALILFLLGFTGVWSGRVGPLRFGIIGFLWMGIALIGTGFWMWWSSKYGKVSEREKLLSLISWRGDAQVLDVGCGRGLLLVGAARRLTTGKATGIDIWQTADLSGNKEEATLENARRENVADRVEIQTADMRKIPFEDGTFDVIVSRAAIHNLYSADDRAAAIREIARVLKPGGAAVIDDIRHPAEYTLTFEQNGCAVTRYSSAAKSMLWTILTFGSLHPATLIVRKSPDRQKS